MALFTSLGVVVVNCPLGFLFRDSLSSGDFWSLEEKSLNELAVSDTAAPRNWVAQTRTNSQLLKVTGFRSRGRQRAVGSRMLLKIHLHAFLAALRSHCIPWLDSNLPPHPLLSPKPTMINLVSLPTGRGGGGSRT